jgi:hypothetical protein
VPTDVSEVRAASVIRAIRIPEDSVRHYSRLIQVGETHGAFSTLRRYNTETLSRRIRKQQRNRMGNLDSSGFHYIELLEN